ncbi:Type 1 glutamine amidotransferase-like domain-containing protein [Mesobacillus jeotgali]|uniref:Type 1 glutamine amidotransferase-like domain-containing protein n=1 Tax=Mesobacillus jeotgali TaxID=129985 RepID=UPI0015900D15|nr:Type 1 glutamine amidotransferase-like domain-containing protein [Mesobacillus jeotgali]
MRKLILLSDVSNNNPALVQKIRKVLTPKPFKLAYVPSRTDKQRKYFEKGKDELERLGVTDFLYFDVDQEFDQLKLGDFKKCDGIFLSGGNTYLFLKNLQERNIFSLIREMVREGKPLIGVSAGSIIMSSSIKIAAFHDENEAGLESLDGLELVDFEFMPHWNSLEKEQDKLLQYSTLQNESIYTCNDGDGIVLIDDDIEFYGDIHEIRKGKFL